MYIVQFYELNEMKNELIRNFTHNIIYVYIYIKK